MTNKLHIDRLSVKNFRALDDLTLEDLGRVNVFVGRNNAGKTTILDAIELLATKTPLILFKQLLRLTKTESLDHNLYTQIDFNFLPLLFSYGANTIEIGGVSSALMIEKDNGKVNFIELSTLVDIHPMSKKTGKLFSFDFDLFKQGYLLKETTTVKAAKTSTPLLLVTTQLMPNDVLEKLWTDIQLTGLEQHVFKALQILDSRIENLAFKQINPSIPIKMPYVRKSDIDSPVLLSSMGDGMSRVLQIILSLLNAKDGILLIDEFENGLHYRIQEALWLMVFTLATELNVQVFVTTHSWDVIESFSKIAVEHPEEGVLYSLGRSRIDGRLNAHRYSEERLYQVTQSEMEVR